MTPSEVPSKQDDASGSPGSGEPVFLAIGRLRRPHGVRGEVLMDVLTDFPERIKPGTTVYIGERHEPLQIKSCRWKKPEMLVSFEGYEDREQAGQLRNRLVFVRSEDRPPLPAGEYYHHELIGMRVVGDTGNELGVLTDILQTGANDIYVVKTQDDAELLLPAIEPVILDIDIEQGVMRVHLLPGLES
jgi:16S rRNA processing protein RimM